MSTNHEPAIQRLVAHHGGPTAFAKLLGEKPAYQEIQRWLARGWASPKYLFAIEPHLIGGIELRDLHHDRVIASAEPAHEGA